MSHPSHPIGYIIYKINTPGSDPIFVTTVTHLLDIRKTCIEQSLKPNDVMVYRLFFDGSTKPLFIHEYSIRVIDPSDYSSSEPTTVQYVWRQDIPNGKNFKVSQSHDSLELTYEIRMSFWTRVKYRVSLILGYFSLRNLFKTKKT